MTVVKTNGACSSISRIMIQVLATVVKVGHAPLSYRDTSFSDPSKWALQRAIFYRDTSFSDCCKSGADSAISYRDTSFSDCYKKNGAYSATSPIMIQILATVVKVGHAPLSYRDKCFSNCRQSGTYSAMSVLS